MISILNFLLFYILLFINFHIQLIMYIYIYLFLCINAATYFSLSNNDVNILLVGDNITSTLGNYVMTLNRLNCTFLIQNFTNGNYQNVGTYQPLNSPVNCQFLTILDSKVLTDTGKIYLSISGVQCNYTYLLIDDLGIIRLSCVQLNMNNQNGSEFNFSEFQIKNNYLATTSASTVNTLSVLNPIQNNRGWNISASNGFFYINNTLNPLQNVSYNYTGFNIYPSFFVDWLNNPPPSLFPNLKYYSKCRRLNGFNFTTPFLFQFDPYWPILRVMDQTGYLILKISYPNIDCVNDYGFIDSKHSKCEYSVCPPQLFQFQGNCVSVCPSPYFHSIRQYDNRCLLNCEMGAKIDTINRVCSCELVNIKNPNCTNIPYSNQYISGCNCTLNLFFDGFSCVQICPPQKFGFSGICLTCPFKCSVCQLSNQFNNFAFLNCTKCLEGYILSNGICLILCNSLKASTLNSGNCINCKDPNCISCQSIEICLRCSSLYTLQNSSCKLNCNSTNTLVYSSVDTFYCVASLTTPCEMFVSGNYQSQSFLQCLFCSDGYVLGDLCVKNCQNISSEFESNITTKTCMCANSNKIMINKKCYNMNSCPIKMYLDQTTQACLSCSFGCLICQPITKYCVLCSPGYILLAYDIPNCVYNSPFYSCPNNSNVFRGYICIPNIVSIPDYSNCGISECLSCAYKSTSVCILCVDSTYLFNNVCVSNCPSNTFIYNYLCIQNGNDPNCLQYQIGSLSNYNYISYQQISSTNSTYQTFYATSLDLQINTNPVAGIIYKYNESNKRIASFRQAKLFCKLCAPKYAPGPDGICVPCALPCSTCIRPDNYSCTSCILGYYVGNGRQCISYGSKCMLGQFRNYFNQCSFNCYQFYLIQNESLLINCTQSCPKGNITNNGSLYLICNNNQVKSGSNSLYAVVYKTTQNYQIFFIPKEPFSKLSGLPTPIISKFGDNRLLQSISNITNHSTIITDQYIALSAPLNVHTLILNFSGIMSEFNSTKGNYFSDSFYGVDVTNIRVNQLQNFLTWIGAFISFMLIILHIIYIGNGLIYKVDNVLIFTQVIYYFIYTKATLVPLMPSFFYGFHFSNLGFIQNSFNIPQDYIENAPIGFKLINLDCNLIRNAGGSYLILIIFVSIYLVVLVILYYLSNYKKSVWSTQIKMDYMFGFLQLIFPNILYFSIGQFLYGRTTIYAEDPKFTLLSQILGIFSITGILIYCIVRLYFNIIAGIFCWKRFIFIMVLVLSANSVLFNLFLILFQISFIFIRLKYQQAETPQHYIFIIIEQSLKVLTYIIITFSSNIYLLVIWISLLQFFYLSILFRDLGILYVEQLNYLQEKQIPKQNDSNHNSQQNDDNKHNSQENDEDMKIDEKNQ